MPTNTDLAVDRTRLAHERTLMAWIRTAVSLISFGFTIYKFFQYMVEQNQVVRSDRLLGPREVALLMISIGIIALFLATFQHVRDMRRLRKSFPRVPLSTASGLAFLVWILGSLALLAVIFRQ